MRILLLCSAFNGLSQRAWIELTETGHDVRVQLATADEAMVRAVAEFDPDLVICPFLRNACPPRCGRIAARSSSIPARRATEDLPPWTGRSRTARPSGESPRCKRWKRWTLGRSGRTRTFPIDAAPPRKSRLYNEAVADAAIDLVREVVLKAADRAFVPETVDGTTADVHGRARPMMRQSDRQFSWSDPSERVLRRIRAADGSPGVRTILCGLPVSVFDAHPGPAGAGEPGAVVARRHGAVLVRTGDGAIWVGHARRVPDDGERFLKLPAVSVLGRTLGDVPESLVPLEDPEPGSDTGRSPTGGRATSACSRSTSTTGPCRPGSAVG